MKVDFLKKKIEIYLKKEQLAKGEEYIKLEKAFLKKARKKCVIC